MREALCQHIAQGINIDPLVISISTMLGIVDDNFAGEFGQELADIDALLKCLHHIERLSIRLYQAEMLSWLWMYEKKKNSVSVSDNDVEKVTEELKNTSLFDGSSSSQKVPEIISVVSSNQTSNNP